MWCCEPEGQRASLHPLPLQQDAPVVLLLPAALLPAPGWCSGCQGHLHSQRQWQLQWCDRRPCHHLLLLLLLLLPPMVVLLPPLLFLLRLQPQQDCL